MAAAARIDWIACEIARGRTAAVSFHFNKQNSKETIKFILEPQSMCSAIGVFRPCVLHALNGVKAALAHNIVTDKGHEHKSTGCTIIKFWVEQPGMKQRSKLDAMNPDAAIFTPTASALDDGTNQADEEHVGGNQLDVPEESSLRLMSSPGATDSNASVIVSHSEHSTAAVPIDEEKLKSFILEIFKDLRGKYTEFKAVVTESGTTFGGLSLESRARFLNLLSHQVATKISAVWPELDASSIAVVQAEKAFAYFCDCEDGGSSSSAPDCSSAASSSQPAIVRARLHQQHPPKRLKKDPGFGKGPRR